MTVITNMNIVFLQLGSNLGNRKLLLKDAVLAIEDKVGSVVEESRIYESTPWRSEGQGNYLNQPNFSRQCFRFFLKPILYLKKTCRYLQCLL